MLVFGAMLKLLLAGSLPSAVPTVQRVMIIETARDGYTKLVGNMRLKTGQKAFIPKSTPNSLGHGDKILVYRDTSERWEPRTFISRNENTILVLEPGGDQQPYPITRVSEYREGSIYRVRTSME